MSNERIKYPRTPHLPWSPGVDPDDKILDTFDHFFGQEVVVTEKMDGENTTVYSDYMHARSIDSPHHVSRDWVKAIQARISYDLPQGWRICGENLYAKHSLKYTDLSDYFQVFSIWDEDNEALSWDETVQWCQLLNLTVVPVLWRGIWDKDAVRNITVDETRQEGYVVRLADSFPFEQFDQSIAKWVRKNHVQTDQHWRQGQIEPNELKD